MGNFVCKMHLLVNFASECDKTLKVFEKVARSDDFKENPHVFQTSESGPARLVRTSVKAVHPHGSEEAGVASYFLAFLQGKGEKLNLVSYRGNRFNILFYDSAALYHHRQHLREFLSTWPNPNNLISAVLSDLSDDVNLAGARALGIIDKLITGPLWRILEKATSVLDVNDHLLQLKLSCERFGKDASLLLEAEPVFVGDVALHKDELYDALFKPTDVTFDSLTQEALEMMLTSMLWFWSAKRWISCQGGEVLPARPSFENPNRKCAYNEHHI
jgi:hypothetical protein